MAAGGEGEKEREERDDEQHGHGRISNHKTALLQRSTGDDRQASC